MTGLTPKGNLQYANDAITADLIQTITSATYAALVAALGPSVATALADNPDVQTEVNNAVTAAVSGAGFLSSLSTSAADFEGAVGDHTGTPSWVRFDALGQPTPYATAALVAKGLIGATATTSTDYAGAIADQFGNPTYLQFDAAGLPTRAAESAIENRVTHFHVGPLPPRLVYPGVIMYWLYVSVDGGTIELRKGIGS